MNILFVTRFYPDSRIGGIERVTGILSKHFHNQGLQVYCLHFEKSKYDGSLGNIVHACHLQDLYDKERIKDYLTKNNINVVINQSHFFYSPFLSSVVHEIGAKLITCCHSSTSMKTISREDAIKQTHGLKRFLLTFAYPLFKFVSERKLKRKHLRSFRCSNKTVLLSKSIKEEYAHKLGIDCDDSRLDYISNPLSFESIISDEELEKKDNIVLVVARLYEPQKRLSLLFNIWKRVQRDDWKLVVVGDGEDRGWYENMVRELELKNVFFEGVQQPQPYYHKAKIFTMTSSWEGLPMTIIESFQMGVVPVVMDSFPAAKDMIQDGKNGYLVDDGDTFAFAKELHELMIADDKLQALALGAIASSNRYEIGEIGAEWMKILLEYDKREI